MIKEEKKEKEESSMVTVRIGYEKVEVPRDIYIEMKKYTQAYLLEREFLESRGVIQQGRNLP